MHLPTFSALVSMLGLGAGPGFFSGLFGIGRGIICIPLLVLAFAWMLAMTAAWLQLKPSLMH